MKNTCPKCDTAYNVNASVVGRKFTCKNCNTPVVVTAAGLDYQNAPPAAAPAAGAGAAFDFDADAAGALQERKLAPVAKPAKPAREAKPARRRPRDEEDELDGEKPAEDDLDSLPARKPKRQPGQKSKVSDFLFFREFIAPIFVKLIFVLSLLVIVGSGIVSLIAGVISGKLPTILGGLAYLVIGVPFLILLARIYCELVLLGFALYDRLGEIKALLEKNAPTPPLPPTGPPAG